jgi:hypothetical protein
MVILQHREKSLRTTGEAQIFGSSASDRKNNQTSRDAPTFGQLVGYNRISEQTEKIQEYSLSTGDGKNDRSTLRIEKIYLSQPEK